MNALLPSTTQDHVNFLWEPFATSTPLKIVPNNVKIGELLHKQLLTGSNDLMRKPLKRLSTSSILQSKLAESRQSIPKKAKKNKSSAYLDFSSSSSDEDSGETKRRPIIKVSSKKTRSLLNVKKLGSEETELVNKECVNVSQKVDNTKKVKSAKNNEKNTIPTVTDWEGRNGRGKNRGKSGNVNTNGVSKSACESSDEECKIFDESNTNKNMVNSVKHSLQIEQNIVSYENVTKSKKPGDGNETDKTKVCEAHLKATHTDDNKMQIQKWVPKAASNNNKLSKLLKRKDSNTVRNGKAEKKSSVSYKLPGETAHVEKPIIPLKLWGNKSNHSHQLFSDSREQEFIDTLDLTTEDINESVAKITCSVSNHGKITPIKHTISTNQDKDACKNGEAKQERPARRKQKPKEYWMVENISPTSVRGTVNKQTQSKRNIKTLNGKLQVVAAKQKEGDVVIKGIRENHKSKKVMENVGPKGMKKTKRKKGNVLKEKMSNAPDDEEAVVTSTNEDEVNNEEINHEMKQSGLSTDVKLDEVIGEKAVTADKTVFQLFSELSFKENKVGCSAVQCHSTNNFKCGVLKLKVKSEFKCKTLHSNSHLGGVVLKGLIRMKVGEKELELKEGDMAFVPPLTEWQATNISESESVFYYWCSRFK